MSEKQKILNRPGVRGLLAAGAVGAAVTSGMGALNAQAKAVRQGQEVEALRNIDTKTASDLNGDVIVAHSGVKWHDTPDMYDDPQSNDSSTAGEVPDGQDMIINSSATYHDKKGNTWAGFQFGVVDEQTKGGKYDQAADQTFWINMSQLQGQTDGQGHSLVEEFPAGTAVQDAIVGEHGQLTNDSGSISTNAVLMPHDSAQAVLGMIKNSKS